MMTGHPSREQTAHFGCGFVSMVGSSAVTRGMRRNRGVDNPVDRR